MLKSASKTLGLAEQRVYYSLVVAFGLLFILPSLGFINFVYKYDFFSDRHLPYYFLSVLLFSYLGFFILRSYADRIRSISESIENSISDGDQISGSKQTSELNRIVFSFRQLLDRFEENNQALELKVGQLRSLGELTDGGSAFLDEDVLLELALQKACGGICAGRGTVLLLDESRRHHFTIACEIDTSDTGRNRIGRQIPFVGSKFEKAVVQRRPLFLTDSAPHELLTQSVDKHGQDGTTGVVVPLVTANDVLGVMCLENKTGSIPFSRSDLDFILPLVSCLSHRYENLQLQELISLKTDQFNCLSTLNRVCNLGLLRGKLFQSLVRELCTFMPVKVAFLALYTSKREYLELLEVASEAPISLRSGMRLPLRQSLFNSVLEENRELYRENVTDLLHPLEARWFQELGVDSCYLAPFRIQGVNAGVFFVGCDSKQGFSSSEQVILLQMGEYLGLAMHNQILLQQVDEKNRELEALNLVASVLTSSLFDLDEIVDRVVTLLEQMIAVEGGAIYLRDKNLFVVKKVFGTLEGIEPSDMPSDEGIFAFVTSRGESVLIRDVSRNPHLSFLVKDFGGVRPHSILCVPMVIGKEVVGAIHLWNKQHDTFTTHDEKIMKSVAASLATAVASCRPHRLCQRQEIQARKIVDDQVVPERDEKIET